MFWRRFCKKTSSSEVLLGYPLEEAEMPPEEALRALRQSAEGQALRLWIRSQRDRLVRQMLAEPPSRPREILASEVRVYDNLYGLLEEREEEKT